MRKIFLSVLLTLLFLTGCGSNPLHVSVETAPRYQAEQSYPMILKITDNEEPLSGLDIVAVLEMARMDHGIIDVDFTDQGNGTYRGEVTLPMAGEWIADIVINREGKEIEEMVTFQVDED